MSETYTAEDFKRAEDRFRSCARDHNGWGHDADLFAYAAKAVEQRDSTFVVLRQIASMLPGVASLTGGLPTLRYEAGLRRDIEAQHLAADFLAAQVK